MSYCLPLLKSPLCAALVLSALPVSAAQAPNLEFLFSVTDESPDGLTALRRDPRVVRLFEDGPCGATVSVRMARMPKADETAFRADVAVELSLEGEKLREWHVPYESWPVAVKGDEVLVDNDGQQIWIKTDGSFRADSSREMRTGAETCPDPVNALQDGYCAMYQDLNDGRARYFATGDICT